MEKIIIYILLTITLATSTILFVMLLKAFKHIKILESKKENAERSATHHIKELQNRSEVEFDDFVEHKYK